MYSFACGRAITEDISYRSYTLKCRMCRTFETEAPHNMQRLAYCLMLLLIDDSLVLWVSQQLR